jgi:NAD(P)-dependent dehydrogenase (short-subunit alcohol dehydrogenase family)
MSAGKDRERKPRPSTAGNSSKELFRLDEKTILITGGGGAMGLEVTSAILEVGGDVICADRADSPLQELWAKVQRIAQRYETQVWYYTCDITNVEDVRKLFETALAKTRYPLQGLMTCAGVSGGGPTVHFSIDEVRRILDINVVGTFVCAQAAAREMIKHNVTGSMVFVASMSAHGSNKVRQGGEWSWA